MTNDSYQVTWSAAPHVLYFIAAGHPPQAIKIGVCLTTRLRTRMSEHQGGNHESLHLLGTVRLT